MKNNLKIIISMTILGVVILIANSTAAAQGRGKGNAGGSRAGGASGGSINPQPARGNSDFGLGRASQSSNGRSDAGLERARQMRENALRAERVLQNNPNIPDLLQTNASDLREQYQAALADNPNLKFGQFVAAGMLARNLGSRFPNVTVYAILDSLANGGSIGSALRNLGVSSDESREAVKLTKTIIKRK